MEKVLSIRKSQNWSIGQNLLDFTQQSWYANAQQLNDNNKLYSNNITMAESFLYSNMPLIPILISYVNDKKCMASFITADKHEGFFKYSKCAIFKKGSPEVNQVYLIRAQRIASDDITNILSIELPNDEDYRQSFFKDFSGIIKINAIGNFGFVVNEDIFVTSDLTKDLQNYQKVSGVAVINFNKKKNTWGWKAITVY
jgi:hypothetical protein